MVVVGDRNLVSLNELCEQLSISIATGRNWIKLGKIDVYSVIDNIPYFTREYLSDLKRSIVVGENSSLKSRRNKKYVSGNDLYSSYISENSKNIELVQNFIQTIKNLNIELTDEIISTIIVNFARQIVCSDGDFLIQDVINNFGYSSDFIDKYFDLLDVKLIDEPNEDILGLLYISLKNLGDRKSKGAYYTPTSIVKKLIASVFDNVDCKNKSVLDPCCGTGNFILQLPESFMAENVYASDIDLMSVLISRINYSKRFKVLDKSLIYKNIFQCDYLDSKSSNKYDYIIGNPPWGVAFSADKRQDLRKKYKSAVGANVESYDVVVEQALGELNRDGILAFVLPEAFLNVKAHKPIRQYMMSENSIKYIEYLGDVFDGVQCPSIILQIIHNLEPFSTKGLQVKTKEKDFIIQIERKVTDECFSFLTEDKEYTLIDKILKSSNIVTLKNNADFALGIVTGDNSKYISNQKTSDNELVLKGSHLEKYRYKLSDNYIIFEPKSFQQVASIDLYRADEKLFYKFISNKLVFAYDDKQILSLNSCNILIPRLKGLSIKYIMAVLNSSVAQFFFAKQFNSIKVLRSHIEQIPIPIVEHKIQFEIEVLVDEIIHADDENYQEKCNILDLKICKLYGLSDEEILLLKG
ncbi:N-6 DNA methylase [bacterium]|nr:N-6 DNA methylase [bacterium]